MYRQLSFSGETTFFQKVRSFVYFLIICVLLLGIISTFSMYSSEGGQVLYYTKSHFIRFSVFFLLMLVFSFIRPTSWHATGYFFYIVVLGLLFYASFLFISFQRRSLSSINWYFVTLEIIRWGILLSLIHIWRCRRAI